MRGCLFLTGELTSEQTNRRRTASVLLAAKGHHHHPLAPLASAVGVVLKFQAPSKEPSSWAKSVCPRAANRGARNRWFGVLSGGCSSLPNTEGMGIQEKPPKTGEWIQGDHVLSLDLSEPSSWKTGADPEVKRRAKARGEQLASKNASKTPLECPKVRNSHFCYVDLERYP